MATLEVGSAKAAPGAKGYGAVEVARRGDGSAIIIPVVLVNGLHDGPTLVVQAGIHGDEFPGMEAVWRLVESLDPADLHGQVIAVPVVNTPSFAICDRVNDIDHQDLNRIFPGKPDGTLSERTAHHLLTEVISKGDCLIDLHAAGAGEIVPLAIARQGHEEMTLELAKAAGFEFIWMGAKLGEGKLGQASINALRLGIPVTTLEVGGGYEHNEGYVDAQYQGVISIMKHLNMIEGEPDVPKRRVFFTADLWPQVGVGGFFRPHVVAGQRVKKGDLVATVHDVYGREMERLEAPRDGLICLIGKKCSVKIGNVAYIFGDIVKEETLE